MGFIDLFCKPLFTAMSGCIDGELILSTSTSTFFSKLIFLSRLAEFHDFAEKLRDGRAAWETISLQTDAAFSQPAPKEFRLSPAPPPRRSPSSTSLNSNNSSSSQPSPNSKAVKIAPPIGAPGPSILSATKPINLPSEPSFTSRPLPFRAVSQRHGRNASNTSNSSTKSSPLSPIFVGSASSATTGTSSFSQLSSLSANNGRATTDLSGLLSCGGGGKDTFLTALSTSGGMTNSLLSRGACGGACQATTALCVICAAAQRRGSLPTSSLVDSDGSSEEEDEELDMLEDREDPDLWPPYPFQ